MQIGPLIWFIRVSIVLTCGTMAVYTLLNPAPTDKDIIATVNDVRDQLTLAGQSDKGEILSKLDELNRLVKEAELDTEYYLTKQYPLGYVMFACSGEHKSVVYDHNTIRMDFSKFRVNEESVNGERLLRLYVPRMTIHMNQITLFLERMTLGVVAEVGQTERCVFSSVFVQLEVIQAKPIGLVAVLGFREVEAEDIANVMKRVQ